MNRVLAYNFKRKSGVVAADHCGPLFPWGPPLLTDAWVVTDQVESSAKVFDCGGATWTRVPIGSSDLLAVGDVVKASHLALRYSRWARIQARDRACRPALGAPRRVQRMVEPGRGRRGRIVWLDRRWGELQARAVGSCVALLRFGGETREGSPQARASGAPSHPRAVAFALISPQREWVRLGA